MGDAKFTTGTSRELRLKIVGGRPYLAMTEDTGSGQRLVLYVYDGLIWKPVGPAVSGFVSEVGLEHYGSTLYLAYKTIARLVTVMKYD